MKRIIFSVVAFFAITGLVWAADLKPFVLIPDGVSQYGDTVYFSIQGMDFDRLRDKFIGLKNIAWNKAVIDLFSGGGSVFDAMAMVSLMDEQIAGGRVIEIRGRGIIASAALIVLQGASPGHRILDPLTMVMFHELSSFKLFSVETPTSKEEEAKIYRKIQDQVLNFIASKSLITKEELDSRIRNKEFWMDANEALKYGFADKIWGK